MENKEITYTGYPRMLGTSDEVLQCECCGKTDLKRTVVIAMDQDSEPVYFGSDCAARTLRYRGIEIKAPKIQRIAEQVEISKSAIARHASDAARLEEMRAAGHKRYVIGGKEIGAELDVIIRHAHDDLQRESVRLSKLQLLVAA